MRIYKCKLCGEPLDITKAANGAIKCGVCDCVNTLPKDTASERLLNFLDNGEFSLDKGDFEGALTAYTKAAELDENEPEAYFGKALAKFKVRYLKDVVNNRLQPICYEITDKKFSDDPDYMRAFMKGTAEQRIIYKSRAKEIDYIQSEFYKLKQSGVDYDCFICVKVTDDKGNKTADYKSADDIYFELKGKGYKPFFSERELGKVTGADYEARILYALYSSECMLVVCHDEAYLQTKWVKNEYSRFLKLVNDSEKETDSITIAYGGRPIEKLPGRDGKIQGIDLNKLGALGKVVDFVDSHTPETRKKRQAAIDERRYAEAEREKRERKLEEQQRQLAKKLETLNKGQHSTIENLLTRAWQELEARDFVKAERFFETVLESAPENEEAWRGKFLCSFNVTTESAITVNEQNAKNIIVDKNLNNYLKYRTDNTHDKEYADILAKAQAKIEAQINNKNKDIRKTKAKIQQLNTKKYLIFSLFILKIAIPLLLIIIIDAGLLFSSTVEIGLIYVPTIGMALLLFGLPYLIRKFWMMDDTFLGMDSFKGKINDIKDELQTFKGRDGTLDTLRKEISYMQTLAESCKNLLNDH